MVASSRRHNNFRDSKLQMVKHDHKFGYPFFHAIVLDTANIKCNSMFDVDLKLQNNIILNTCIPIEKIREEFLVLFWTRKTWENPRGFSNSSRNSARINSVICAFPWEIWKSSRISSCFPGLKVTRGFPLDFRLLEIIIDWTRFKTIESGPKLKWTLFSYLTFYL